MPGVVAMSGIVPAAISLPLPFNTGSKIPLGVVRTILALSVSAIPRRSSAFRKGFSRFNTVKNKEVCAKQSVFEFFDSRNVICRAVFAIAEADANVSDYRSVAGTHLARTSKLFDKSG